MRLSFTATIVAVGLCLIAAGVSQAAVTNIYWRVDLHQGSSIIAYGQGSTEALAWEDCFRLQAITRAMTATETRRNAVAAITGSVVRWCQNPKRYATVSPDPIVLPPVDCVVSAWSAWSDPAWLACADGMQSRSIVRTRTIVTQPLNGGAACPSLVETQPQTQACTVTPVTCVNRICRLNWTHEGTPAEGFRLVYGPRADQLPGSVQVTPGTVRTGEVTVTAAGVWYFAVIAFGGGNDSPLSNIIPQTVQ
jgi:hypothetical protein